MQANLSAIINEGSAVVINLVTDAPKHNLALMKMSTLQKANGNSIHLNGVGNFDMSIGSWLFKNSEKVPCDYEGGPGVDPKIRNEWCDTLWPDYELFNLDFSLGYTWSYCPRKCEFCIVPEQNNPRFHQSIWSFHNSKFKKICLLNNNTFSDPQWKETFEEIWDADLTVIDENGYDLRLLNEEKADALKRTKFHKMAVYFSWDRMEDEGAILKGLELLKRFRLNGHNTRIHVLIGFDTDLERDLYRCQKIIDIGPAPYPMPYVINDYTRSFKRFINLHYYRSYPTLKEAWSDYKRKPW